MKITRAKLSDHTDARRLLPWPAHPDAAETGLVIAAFAGGNG